VERVSLAGLALSLPLIAAFAGSRQPAPDEVEPAR
jgi:hypothetical protein